MKSQADVLIDLTENWRLFHDQRNEAFAFLNRECVSLRSQTIRQRLAKLLWDEFQGTPSSGALTQAITFLEAKARFDNPQIFLFNRIAKGPHPDNSFYYDLGDRKAVRVTAQGWNVVDAPVLFRHFGHQRNQVAPVAAGDPWTVFSFINVAPEHQLLFLVYLISCLVPEISHPVIYAFGDHGSGKTSVCTTLKEVVDPSSLKTQLIPKNPRELFQILNHQYLPVFDNLSSLEDFASDAFSVACTGGGLSKRQLYTDDDDIIYEFKRCIVLNGINLVIQNADLMDRSILFPLERISSARRKKEMELWEEFERLKPSILGAIFDTLARAISIFPSVQLSWTPRMVDFGAWGFAIAEALGKAMGEKFLEAYRKNIDYQIDEVIQANTLAQSVLSLMDDRNDWKGTVGMAWDRLYEIAGQPRKDDSTFPTNARTLRKHLASLKPILRHHGIYHEIYPRTKDGYPMMFSRNLTRFGSFASSSAESTTEIKELIGESNEGNEVKPLLIH